MTIDNVFAIVLLPFLGALSDRTRTRLGRRRPYILVGSILAAVLLRARPLRHGERRSSGLMMVTVILLNLSMALFRSPVIALMPDITPPRFRSQANGIINFMGGLGSLLVYFGGKPAVRHEPRRCRSRGRPRDARRLPARGGLHPRAAGRRGRGAGEAGRSPCRSTRPRRSWPRT